MNDVGRRILLLPGMLVWAGMLCCVFSAFLFAPWLMNLGIIASLASAALAGLLIWRGVLLLQRAAVPRLAGVTQRRAAWIAIVACGALLRLAWGLTVPAVLGGDAQSFHETALRLLSEHRYASVFQDVAGVLDRQVLLVAWRPPGFPLLLAGWYAVFGSGQASIVGFNVVTYGLTAWALGAIALRMLGRGAVFPVLALLAFWPKLVLLGAVPLTEGVSLLFVLLIVLAFDLVIGGKRGVIVPAGLAFGIGALIRPSLLLMPAAWVAMASGAAGSLWRRAAAVAVATAVGLACILPWSIRNHVVLGEFVLLSTNSGDVLYRANNPLATGNFIPAGTRDLSVFLDNEALWNRMGSQWAREWILENPLRFLENSIRKLGYFWGWAEDGNTARLYYPEIGLNHPALTQGVELATNISWLVLLGFVGAALIARRRILLASPMAVGLMTSSLILTVVHAVYESHARYNMPILGALFLLAVAGPCLPRPPSPATR